MEDYGPHVKLQSGNHRGGPIYMEHDINTGDRPPIRCAPRRMSPQKMKKEEECVAEMLTGDQIEPSDSPWSSPVVLVTKKDAGTRFCVNYHHLNDVTTKDAYLDMLAGKQWFYTLDLASGYWQVSLSQEARVKTAFATHSGLFQFRVTPFSLCNAPATFERLMDRVLQGLRWIRCLVYLDDIIYFGLTFDGTLTNLTLIFERLRSYGLQLNPPSATCSGRRYHSWDTSLVGMVWSATLRRLRTSKHGRSLIVLRVYTSFWDLSATTDASSLILLMSQPHW